jgi:hypothetical protein
MFGFPRSEYFCLMGDLFSSDRVHKRRILLLGKAGDRPTTKDVIEVVTGRRPSPSGSQTIQVRRMPSLDSKSCTWIHIHTPPSTQESKEHVHTLSARQDAKMKNKADIFLSPILHGFKIYPRVKNADKCIHAAEIHFYDSTPFPLNHRPTSKKRSRPWDQNAPTPILEYTCPIPSRSRFRPCNRPPKRMSLCIQHPLIETDNVWR